MTADYNTVHDLIGAGRDIERGFYTEAQFLRALDIENRASRAAFRGDLEGFRRILFEDVLEPGDRIS